MGRETKILLALLATLGGVFLGVLSMKLLVPRPPLGAGPDVHVDVATAEPIELVDPPALSPQASGPASASDFAAAPSADDEAGQPEPPRYAESRMTADPGDLMPPPKPLEPQNASSPASLPQTAALDDDRLVPPAAARPIPAAHPRQDPFVTQATLQVPIAEPVAPSAQQPVAAASSVANPGDSWWDLAERAYGDGRLYRALFAWNRVIDPRVSLAPGTRLEIPSRTRLEAAWPKLIPAE